MPAVRCLPSHPAFVALPAMVSGLVPTGTEGEEPTVERHPRPFG